MSLKVGERIRIESYKYGDRLHRLWKESTVLKIGEPLIVANCNAQVVEADGSERVYPGLAICLFSKVDWFHPVILFDSEERVEKYYVDIASPYEWDQVRKTVRYVDYDLDLIIQPDLSYVWVDQEEYERHASLYHYPESIQKRITAERIRLEQRVKQKQPPFSNDFARHWYRQCQSILK